MSVCSHRAVGRLVLVRPEVRRGHRHRTSRLGRLVPLKRTAQALAESFGTPLSAGTVAAITRRTAAGLDGFRELVRERIAVAQVAHFDETGLRVAGRLRCAFGVDREVCADLGE
jgi:Transposase IS66 family